MAERFLETLQNPFTDISVHLQKNSIRKSMNLAQNNYYFNWSSVFIFLMKFSLPKLRSKETKTGPAAPLKDLNMRTIGISDGKIQINGQYWVRSAWFYSYFCPVFSSVFPWLIIAIRKLGQMKNQHSSMCKQHARQTPQIFPYVSHISCPQFIIWTPDLHKILMRKRMMSSWIFKNSMNNWTKQTKFESLNKQRIEEKWTWVNIIITKNF